VTVVPAWGASTRPGRYKRKADRSHGTEVDVYPNQSRSQDEWPAQPPEYREGRSRRPPRRRRRRWIGLLITLVVIVVLLAVGDQVARAYAQNTIAGKIQSSSGMSVKPSVTIQGWPFLTQVAEHDLRVVDISASNVPAGKITITSIHATATGVHLNSGFTSATVNQINGTALITFASVESAVGVSGVATIGADPAAGPNAVKLSAGPISATGYVKVSGPNAVTVTMGSLSGLGSLLGGAVPDQTQTIQIPKLPAGLVVRSVSVTSQGIVGTASAQNTTLAQ
jgi:LmeA-like phospholipid-binding